MEPDIIDVTAERAQLATAADREHVKLLAVFHFVYAGLLFLIGWLGSIYVVMGVLMVTGKLDGNNPPPPELGWMFAGIGAFVMLLIWTAAGLIVLAGRRLLQHRSRLFCMIIAGLMCLNVPLGTVLGIFTLVVVSRPGVRELFGES